MSQFSKIIFYKYLIFLCFVATLIDWKKKKSPNFPYLACYKIELFSKIKIKNPRNHSRRISNIFLVDQRKTPSTRFSIETNGTFFFSFFSFFF